MTHLPPSQGARRVGIPPPGAGGPSGPGPGPVRWGLVAGVAVACTLAVSAVGLGASAPDRAARSPDAATTTTTAPPTTTVPPTTAPPTTTAPTEWNPRVADLVAFVEQERGLAYQHPVPVDFLSPTDYDSSVGPGSLGYYDGDRIVARGTDLNPALQGTLVHELTHVLDDQHFDLFAIDADPDASPEAQLAYSGLVEGDATRVERAYDEMLVAGGVPPEEVMDSPPSEPGEAPSPGEAPGHTGPDPGTGGPGPDSRTAPPTLGSRTAPARVGQGELGGAAGSDVAGLVDALDMAPYYVGEQLVDVLLAEGGNPAVDAAFGDPPVTTEQVLDPRAYLDRDPADAVARPVPAGAAGGEDVRVRSVGAINLYVLLAAGIDPSQALDAVTGWGGEFVVSYDDAGGRECIDYAAVGDSPEETGHLSDALDTFAGSGVAEEASVAARTDGSVVLTACGLDSGDNRFDPLETLTLPAMRAEAMRIALHERGYGSREAFGYGECVIDAVGYESIRSFVTDVVAPPGAEAEFRQAFTSC